MVGKYVHPDTKATPPKIEKMACRSCGGNLEIRAKGYTQTIACQYCGAIHDLSTDKLDISSYQSKKFSTIKPLIPLGTRGKLHGVLWEVIGFAQRKGITPATSEDISRTFIWHEYLLFNPFKGFRWLTECRGHWNYIVALHQAPSISNGFFRINDYSYMNENFAFYEQYTAVVNFVVGEFYWRIKAGDTSEILDYVHQTRILSHEKMLSRPFTSTKLPPIDRLQIGGLEISESKPQQSDSPSAIINPEDQEQNWSLAEYIEREEIEKAFQLNERLPKKAGVIINQPIPRGNELSTIAAITSLGTIVLFALGIGFLNINRSNLLVDKSFTRPEFQEVIVEVKTDKSSEASQNPSPSTNPPQNILIPSSPSTEVSTEKRLVFVDTYTTPSFIIDNDTGVLELALQANVDNSWVEVEVDLINEQTGETKNFAIGVEYYHGYDYDGSWAEGKRSDSWSFSALPKGKYHLELQISSKNKAPVKMNIKLYEGVSSLDNLLFSLFLLFLPAALIFAYMLFFEWLKKES